MRTPREILSLLICLLLVQLGICQARDVTYGMKYEGGSRDLNQHDKLKVELGTSEIRIIQGKKNHSVPTNSVTEVSYGNDVHRRVGAAIGAAVVSLGIGLMLLLVKTKKHYVGMTWNEPGTDKKGGVVFKVGKGDYRGFLASLEGLTGLHAVDSDKHEAPVRAKAVAPAPAPDAGQAQIGPQALRAFSPGPRV